MVTVKEDSSAILKASLVNIEVADEIQLYCHSTGKEKKEKAINRKELKEQQLP